jgi:hypothetical protein
MTSLFAEYGDPHLVSQVLQGSSTDVVHLAQSPVSVLVASALWIAGGLTSVFVIAFLLVLTALERRIGGWRTAGVFLLGHILATLATEVPIGLSVLAGHLPGSSLQRYDYGISFGVAASIGALAGLLTPWLRWALLGVFGWMVLGDLIAFTDPMTNWGHLMALAIGVATWPLVRRVSGPAVPRHRVQSGQLPQVLRQVRYGLDRGLRKLRGDDRDALERRVVALDREVPGGDRRRPPAGVDRHLPEPRTGHGEPGPGTGPGTPADLLVRRPRGDDRNGQRAAAAPADLPLLRRGAGKGTAELEVLTLVRLLVGVAVEGPLGQPDRVPEREVALTPHPRRLRALPDRSRRTGVGNNRRRPSIESA